MSRWGRYRKKPVVIEAMQLVGTNADTHAVYQWIEANTQGSFDPLSEEIPASGVSIDPATGFFLIATLEGVMQAKPGDWIIRGVQGEFYPCKPDIFAATYEPAEVRFLDFAWTSAFITAAAIAGVVVAVVVDAKIDSVRESHQKKTQTEN